MDVDLVLMLLENVIDGALIMIVLVLLMMLGQSWRMRGYGLGMIRHDDCCWSVERTRRYLG